MGRKRKFDRKLFLYLVFLMYMFVYILILPADEILRIFSTIGLSVYTLVIYGEMKKLRKKTKHEFDLLGGD